MNEAFGRILLRRLTTNHAPLAMIESVFSQYFEMECISLLLGVRVQFERLLIHAAASARRPRVA
jgi:hypothetical protein